MGRGVRGRCCGRRLDTGLVGTGRIRKGASLHRFVIYPHVVVGLWIWDFVVFGVSGV